MVRQRWQTEEGLRLIIWTEAAGPRGGCARASVERRRSSRDLIMALVVVGILDENDADVDRAPPICP